MQHILLPPSSSKPSSETLLALFQNHGRGCEHNLVATCAIPLITRISLVDLASIVVSPSSLITSCVSLLKQYTGSKKTTLLNRGQHWSRVYE